MNTPFALLAALLLTSTAQATEVDDLSAYYVPLQNADAVLDKQINHIFQAAAEKTNDCSPGDFRKNLKEGIRPSGLFYRIFGGGIEEFAIGSREIEKYKPEIDTSIYKNTPYSRSFIANGAQIIRIATVYPSARINGQVMGLDKLSHFFETGIDLYETFLLPEQIRKNGQARQIDALVKEAVYLEEERLGWLMTGIKSFADLEAHTQGAFFWADFFQPNGEWWECRNNRVQLKKEFHIANHAQAGWSEAVQCNEYLPKDQESYLDRFRDPNPELSFTDEVQINVAELERNDGKRHQCPIVPELCGNSVRFLKSRLPLLNDEQISAITSPQCR